METDEDLVRINKLIEKEIAEDKRKMKSRVKILLLGCGEAGKSTFIKQMKIINSEKDVWTTDEREQYRREILSNVIQCLRMLLDEMTGQLDLSLINTAARLKELKPDDAGSQAKLWEYRDNILALWEDPAIQETYERRNEFHLPDGCRYFLNYIHKVSHPDFIPGDQDILQVRVKTTGVIEYNFKNKEGKEFIMIDVGGQRSERRKWIHCFEDVLLIMFLAAISEYDQVLEEDMHENRLRESLNLFKTILSYHWFINSSITLFLNKKDLLEEKIKKSRLEDHFREFRDFKPFKSQDYEAAKEFMKDLFVKKKKEVELSKAYRDNNTGGVDRSLYIHETCATDTDNIKKVFEDVKDIIFNKIINPWMA